MSEFMYRIPFFGNTGIFKIFFNDYLYVSAADSVFLAANKKSVSVVKSVTWSYFEISVKSVYASVI